MKKVLLLAAFMLCGLCAKAQQGNSITILFPGAPSGTCSPISYAINSATGDLYNCLMGAWFKIGPSAGGGGTPCTVTANSLQYNNAGAFGCVTQLTYSGSTLTGASGLTADFSAVSIFKFKVGAGSTITNTGISGQIPISNGDGTFTNADPIVSGPDAVGATPTKNPVQIGCIFLTAPTTLTNNQVGEAQCTNGQVLLVNVNNFPGTQPVSGTVTANQGGAPWSIIGTLTNNNAAPGTNNVGALICRANASAPSWTEGDMVLCSVDLSGNLRMIGTVTANQGGTWNVTVNTALPAGTNVIGHVITDSGSVTNATLQPSIGTRIGTVAVDQTTPGTTNAVQATNFPATVDTNTGNASGNTPRVVLASNQPAVPVTGTFFQSTQPVSAAVGTFVDGYSATQGSTADIEIVGNNAGSESGKLRGINDLINQLEQDARQTNVYWFNYLNAQGIDPGTGQTLGTLGLGVPSSVNPPAVVAAASSNPTNGFNSATPGNGVMTNSLYVIKTSPGQLTGWNLGNPNASTIEYVLCYDTNNSSSITIGTTQAKFFFTLPGGGGANLLGTIGKSFSTGLICTASSSVSSSVAPATGLVVELDFE